MNSFLSFFSTCSKPDRKKLAERLGLKDSQVWLTHSEIAINFLLKKIKFRQMPRKSYCIKTRISSVSCIRVSTSVQKPFITITSHVNNKSAKEKTHRHRWGEKKRNLRKRNDGIFHSVKLRLRRCFFFFFCRFTFLYPPHHWTAAHIVCTLAIQHCTDVCFLPCTHTESHIPTSYVRRRLFNLYFHIQLTKPEWLGRCECDDDSNDDGDDDDDNVSRCLCYSVVCACTQNTAPNANRTNSIWI